MKGLLKRVGILNVLVIGVGVILVGCGSGGVDPLDLSGGNPVHCNEQTRGTFAAGVSPQLTSADGKATVFANPVQSGQISIIMTVICNIPSFNGKGYFISITGNVSYTLQITYDDSEVAGRDERLFRIGSFVNDPDLVWEEITGINSGIDINNNIATAANLTQSDSSDPFGIYIDSSAGGGGDTTPPSQPTITSISEGPGTVTINWTASSDESGISSYLINRTPDPGTQIGATNGTTLSYTDAGPTDHPLVSGQQYCYTVTAQDGSLNLNRSLPSAPRCIIY